MKHLVSATFILFFATSSWAKEKAPILDSEQQEEDAPAAPTPDSLEAPQPPAEATLPPTNAPKLDTDAKAPESVAVPGELSHRWAAGFNLAWTSRRDYGASTYSHFSPEIVGYMYGDLPFQEWFWRAGSRLGYSNAQPELPQAVRFVETDTTVLFEGSIVRDWYVVPSLTMGAGYDFRTIKVKTQAPVDSSDERLNRKERLLIWYVQAGAGLPLMKGRFMFEPIARYHTIEYDDRSHWTFGIEWTAGI